MSEDNLEVKLFGCFKWSTPIQQMIEYVVTQGRGYCDFYDRNRTPIQDRIEYAVTNGRGVVMESIEPGEVILKAQKSIERDYLVKDIKALMDSEEILNEKKCIIRCYLLQKLKELD